MSTRLLFVDSKNRDTTIYPSGNAYTLHLTTSIKDIQRVDLVSARVPNTLYNLTNGSNVLSISSNTFSLNTGFYSVSGLALAITNQGSASVTYLANEGHFIFYYLNIFTLFINSLELSTMLGLPINTLLTSTLATSTDPTYAGMYIIRSSTLVNMSVNEYLYLDIEELRTTLHVDTGALVGATGTVSGSNANRSFAPIIMDCISGSIKSFNESEDYKIRVQYPEPINSLQRLTVRWVDSSGKLVNFQGWETNAFILRLHLKDDIVPLPPPPPLQDVELKRIIDAITFSIPPPEVEKKSRIPWVFIILILVIGVVAWKNMQVKTLHPTTA